MINLLLLLPWFIPIWLNAYLDRNGAKRDYRIVFIFRGAAAIFHGVLMQVSPSYSCDFYWPEYFPILCFQVTSYWIFFELILNAYRNNPALYFDQKEKDSGWVDRFFAWKPTLHLFVKVLAFIVMVLSIIVIYKK
jgi:hypothetical protein